MKGTCSTLLNAKRLQAPYGGGSGGGYVYLEGARALSLSLSLSLAFRIPSLSLFQNTARIKGAGTFWTR